MNLFYLVESVLFDYSFAVLSSHLFHASHKIRNVHKWKYGKISKVKHCWFVSWRSRSEIGKENCQMRSERNIQSFILKMTLLSLHCCDKVIIGIDGCIMERTSLICFCFDSAFLRVFIWYDCFIICVILIIYIPVRAEVSRWAAVSKLWFYN